jgi:hypothetical protein
MPIPNEIRRKFYSRSSGWLETRTRILDRAQHCCERCGAPRGSVVFRWNGNWYDANQGVWIGPGKELVDSRPPVERGRKLSSEESAGFLKLSRPVPVQIGIAHLNHTPGDDRDENLAAWCRECHLFFDVPKHAETRATHKDQRRPLLTIAAEPKGCTTDESTIDHNYYRRQP